MAPPRAAPHPLPKQAHQHSQHKGVAGIGQDHGEEEGKGEKDHDRRVPVAITGGFVEGHQVLPSAQADRIGEERGRCILRFGLLRQEGQTALLCERIETGKIAPGQPALELQQGAVVLSHATGLGAGLGVFGSGQVAREQEDPAAQGFMVRLHLLEGCAGCIQLPPHHGGGLGADMGAGHGQGLRIGLRRGNQGKVEVAGACVEKLKRHLQVGQGLAERLGLRMGHPIEPEALSAQLIEVGQGHITPGLELPQPGLQGQEPILGLPLTLPCGQGLGNEAIEIEVGIHAGLMATPPHVAQVTQCLPRLLDRPGRNEGALFRRRRQGDQVQTAQPLQPIDQVVLVGREANNSDARQGNNAHRPSTFSFLRLAILEFTTPARSASAR